MASKTTLLQYVHTHTTQTHAPNCCRLLMPLALAVILTLKIVNFYKLQIFIFESCVRHARDYTIAQTSPGSIRMSFLSQLVLLCLKNNS